MDPIVGFIETKFREGWRVSEKGEELLAIVERLLNEYRQQCEADNIVTLAIHKAVMGGYQLGKDHASR